MFNISRTAQSNPAASSALPDALENPARAAAHDAARIQAQAGRVRDPESSSGDALSLRLNLERALQALPRADSALARDLHTVQQAIDTLRQGLDQWERSATGAPGSSRQGAELGERARTGQAAIDETQHALDAVIRQSIDGSRLSGSAMKDFLKEIHPHPDRLIEHSARFLSHAQQSDLADSSKRLQRYAGVARRSDLANRFENLTAKAGVPTAPKAPPEQKARALGWAVTRIGNSYQQSKGIAKLDAAYGRLLKSGDVKELLSALHGLIGSLQSMRSADLRKRAISAALHILHEVSVQHQTGKLRLALEQRAALASTLADIYTAHVERSPDFAEMRLRFVDDELRQHMNAQVPATPKGFDLEHDVLDLRHVAREEDTGTATQAHTRKAQNMDVDGAENRVKEIAYGERAATSEVTATHVIALTGHATPKTRLARYEDNPKAIASQLIPGFQDLGKFVLDPKSVTHLIEKEWGKGGLDRLDKALKAAEEASKELEALPPRSKNADPKDPVVIQTREARNRRYEARKEVYSMLPADIHQKMGKAQFMSQLIADVDFLNFEWFNAGFADGEMAVVLDEGNALDQGFGGKQKGPENVAKANSPARADDPVQKPNQVTEQDHAFSGNVGASRTYIGGIARSNPIAAALASFIKAETRLAEAGTGGQLRDVPAHEAAALSGQLEGAIQLAWVPDKAIEMVAARDWPRPDHPNVPFPDDHEIRRTPEELAKILIERRDGLIAKFTPEERARWKEQHPEETRAAYAQTAAAIAALTGICIAPDGAARQDETSTQDGMSTRDRVSTRDSVSAQDEVRPAEPRRYSV